MSSSAETKYPLATIAPYGPNNRQATKLVVAVFPRPQKEPAALKKWTVASGDVRNDATVNSEVVNFLQEHCVAHAAFADRILGCPHEEGIDYPTGQACPLCPFWIGVDRFTHKPDAKIGRNDPCSCGSGKKYKKCCGTITS